jgi:Raf kinase inhibitor-like YbhB/YbcL family protein
LVRGIIITFIIIISIGCVQEEKRFGNMKLSSQAFENGASIPLEYTCDGADVSPLLTFSDVLENAESLALIMDDPDAPMGTWVHWLIWNIPQNTTVISKGEKITFPQGKNDFGNLYYGGPCPPSGTHRYYFKLYALDTMLDLTAGATKKQLEDTMKGHILEEVQLMGIYSR